MIQTYVCEFFMSIISIPSPQLPPPSSPQQFPMAPPLPWDLQGIAVTFPGCHQGKAEKALGAPFYRVKNREKAWGLL